MIGWLKYGLRRIARMCAIRSASAITKSHAKLARERESEPGSGEFLRRPAERRARGGDWLPRAFGAFVMDGEQSTSIPARAFRFLGGWRWLPWGACRGYRTSATRRVRIQSLPRRCRK